MKDRFKKFYFRIIMIAVYSYPFEFFKFFELNINGKYIPYTSLDYPI